MGDNLAMSDEEAKAVQEGARLGVKALEVVEGVGGWISDVLGDVPKNLVRVLGGDRLAAYREANLEKIAEKAKARNKARGVQDSTRVSLVIALPLFEAAAEESREELQDLWARLLAAAMDPARSGRVRREFIETVKRMEPLDALVLQKMPHASPSPASRDVFAQELRVAADQIELSFVNLVHLGCAASGGGGEQAHLTSLGRELLRVLDD